MTKRLAAILMLVLGGTTLAACEKLDTGAAPLGGAPINFRIATGSIPTDYGRIVAVTPLADSRVAILWFERPDQSITAVRVNVSTGGIAKAVVTVRRN